MKKLFLGLIIVFTVVSFINLVPATAADIVEFIGEGQHGIDDNTRAQDTSRSTSGLNYNKEIYTATAPSSGESYNKSATSIFYPGQVIYLTHRYYIANSGNYTVYYFITDVVGTTVGLFAKKLTLTAGINYQGNHPVSVNTVGSYFLSTLVVGPGQYILGKQFPFIVEY